jgi:hypothetical protein
MEQFSSHWTDFHKIRYLSIFRKTVEKIHVSLKSEKNNGYFTCRPIYIFWIISHSILLRMRNVSNKSCTENQNTFFCSIHVFFEHRAVYEITCKNTVQPDRPQTTIWRMRIACWIPKSRHTHTEYVILTVFPL